MDVETGEREFRERLTEILRATPLLMRVLEVARHLCPSGTGLYVAVQQFGA